MGTLRFLSILVFLQLVIGPSLAVPNNLPQGYFFFEECYGESAGGTKLCFKFTVRINRDRVDYFVDGAQTSRQLKCNLTNDLRCLFSGYADADKLKTGYKEYQPLFHLYHKPGQHFLISDFASPVDGKLVKKKYGLKRAATPR